MIISGNTPIRRSRDCIRMSINLSVSLSISLSISRINKLRIRSRTKPLTPLQNQDHRPRRQMPRQMTLR